MNVKNILLLIFAIGAASLTAYYAKSWMNAERAAILANVPVEKAQPVIQVLVVRNEIKAGSFVRADHMKWQTWPDDGVSEEYAVKGKRELNDFVGAVARNTITPGQPITDHVVVHPGDRSFLAAVLKPGSRAVSVPVNATSGISGFIFPGDNVDLILTSKFNSKTVDGETRARYVTKTLLHALRVLAIDQKTESKEGEVNPAKTVTLEVTPKQAEKVAIGMAVGSLSLSLQSLARLEDEAGNPVTNAVDRSLGYTLDTEVNAMIAGVSRGGGRKVNVLRGDKTEQAAF